MADLGSLASEQRFSNRVENYKCCRPGHPPEIPDLMKEPLGPGKGAAVADVGSGTGISSEWLLKRGALVFGVEPNREMREAAARLLADPPWFHSVDGKASVMTLELESMDFIVAPRYFAGILTVIRRTGGSRWKYDTRVRLGHGERLRTWTREQAARFRSDMPKIARPTGRTHHIFATMQIFLETPARKWR